MFRKVALIVLLLGSVGSKALADYCSQLPESKMRLECATQNHSSLAAKRQRCEEEGRKMGLTPQGMAGGLYPYVVACMKR